MSKELKPCPFCGGEVALRKNKTTGIAFMPVKTHYRVQCLDCQCSTPYCDSEIRAKNSWNRRIK